MSAGSPGRTVVVVVKGYPRLSETFIAQELRGLERLGFHLVIASLRHPTDRTRHPVHDEIAAPVLYLPEYLHEEPARVLRGLVHAMRRRGFASTLAKFLRDLARDPTRNRIRRFGQACVLAAELPDAASHLYAHFIHTPAAVTHYASGITGIAWSCSAHAKDIWTSPDWELAANLAASEWVATCTAVGARHLDGLSLAPGKVHLIYHGLDLDKFPPPNPRPEIRDGTDPTAPVRLLSVGRAVEKKGFDVLLEALARLPRDLAWTFEHLGGGSLLEDLAERAVRLGVGDRITWTGAVAQREVLAAYRRADLFVLPCRIAADGDRDGLPNVLVEAQSQRVACLSTSVSAIPELIEDGVTGCLVPPEDAEALAGAICDLARDPERRAALARAGEARVRQAFEMRAGLGQLASLFPAAVQPRGQTPAGTALARADEAAQ